jgi:hypothetical protein
VLAAGAVLAKAQDVKEQQDEADKEREHNSVAQVTHSAGQANRQGQQNLGDVARIARRTAERMIEKAPARLNARATLLPIRRMMIAKMAGSAAIVKANPGCCCGRGWFSNRSGPGKYRCRKRSARTG